MSNTQTHDRDEMFTLVWSDAGGVHYELFGAVTEATTRCKNAGIDVYEILDGQERSVLVEYPEPRRV